MCLSVICSFLFEMYLEANVCLPMEVPVCIYTYLCAFVFACVNLTVISHLLTMLHILGSLELIIIGSFRLNFLVLFAGIVLSITAAITECNGTAPAPGCR